MPTWNGTADTDARLREQAEKALRQEILLHGYLHLNKVTPVLREAGVDTAVYGGKGPKLWLKKEFSGTFSVVENPDRPGSEIVLMSGSLLTPGNREYTVKLRLDKETGKGLVPGSRLQAALGEALSQDGEEFFHGEVVSILS